MAVDTKAMVPFGSEPFNPQQHLMQIKNKGGATDYLPVQWRLVWFRTECPNGTIDTEEMVIDLDRVVEEEAYVWNNEKRRSEKIVKQAKGYARFRAVITDGKGGRATGTKSENAASFPDFIEKAETGAIGRALAALGYGTQFVGDDYVEGHRIVDAPVESHAPTEPGEVRNAPEPAENALATEQQLSSIHKLCERLSKPEPENAAQFSFIAAKDLIGQLTQEYRARSAQPAQKPAPVPPEAAPDLRDGAAPTDGQLSSIRNLCRLTSTELAGMPETYGDAVKMINTLNDVLKKSRAKKAS